MRALGVLPALVLTGMVCASVIKTSQGPTLERFCEVASQLNLPFTGTIVEELGNDRFTSDDRQVSMVLDSRGRLVSAQVTEVRNAIAGNRDFLPTRSILSDTQLVQRARAFVGSAVNLEAYPDIEVVHTSKEAKQGQLERRTNAYVWFRPTKPIPTGGFGDSVHVSLDLQTGEVSTVVAAYDFEYEGTEGLLSEREAKSIAASVMETDQVADPALMYFPVGKKMLAPVFHFYFKDRQILVVHARTGAVIKKDRLRGGVSGGNERA